MRAYVVRLCGEKKTQRREAMLVDQLLEHWMRDKGSRRGPLQQEIRVQCEAGSNSGARFVLVNSLGRSADIDFNVGHVHELSLERQDAVSIRFDPERARLGANEERLVSMTVQVRDVEGLPDALECGVDVRGGRAKHPEAVGQNRSAFNAVIGREVTGMEPPRVELTDPAPAELELVRSVATSAVEVPDSVSGRLRNAGIGGAKVRTDDGRCPVARPFEGLVALAAGASRLRPVESRDAPGG